MADQPTPDDQPTSEPGGTPVPQPPGPAEPAGHPMTAHDAWVFIQKRIA